ncbi:MAG: hypothetical protein QM831_24010 [Kofleriaceae bacterium]
MPTRKHEPYNSAVIGHGLAVVIGVVSIIAGVEALMKGMPTVLPVTLVILGCVMGYSAAMSWQFSRAAWSLLISTLCVFAAVTFFGSPKIAGVLHVKIWLAMVIPIVQVVAVIMLADLRREYREQ